jgi:hypothetical protein
VFGEVEVDFESLPEEKEVPRFESRYEAYCRESKTTKVIANVVMCVAGLMVFVGGCFLVFGPSTVMVNRFSGPTFIQFLQLYPGPIVSFGALLAFLGAKLVPDNHTPETYMLTYYGLKGEEEWGKPLKVDHVKGDLFRFDHYSDEELSRLGFGNSQENVERADT